MISILSPKNLLIYLYIVRKSLNRNSSIPQKFDNSEDTAFGWQAFLSPEQLKKTEILPWIGVLKVRSGNTEFATGLTLISECHAIANSNDISKLDKETLRISTKAIFFKHNVPRYCDAMDYQIHPEFDNNTLTNSLAILTLNCEKQNCNYDFEQIMFRMRFVHSNKCSDFYVKDGIDFKFLWPKYSFCFKAVNVKRRCVFDSGMALASLHNGNWTLIGISVLGPGCSLPSRYIDVFPYTTWMKEQKKKHILNYRRTFNPHYHPPPREDIDEYDHSEEDENTKKSRATVIDPSKDIVQDKSFFEDLFYIKKLTHSSMVLRPKNANRKEIVRGCKNQDGVVIYRDAGLVRTGKISATGTYALSLYDLHYEEITCIMVHVVCKTHSTTKFWYEKGFKADTWDDLVKVVPHPRRGKPVPPKIWFLKDSYYYYQLIRTSNLVFKFEFKGEASISVDFYGILATTTPTSTSTTTTRRPRRTHPYHIHNTPGYQYERYVKNGPPNYQH